MCEHITTRFHPECNHQQIVIPNGVRGVRNPTPIARNDGQTVSSAVWSKSKE